MEDLISLYKKAKSLSDENFLNHIRWSVRVDPITRRTIVYDPSSGEEITKEELMKKWILYQKQRE